MYARRGIGVGEPDVGDAPSRRMQSTTGVVRGRYRAHRPCCCPRLWTTRPERPAPPRCPGMLSGRLRTTVPRSAAKRALSPPTAACCAFALPPDGHRVTSEKVQLLAEAEHWKSTCGGNNLGHDQDKGLAAGLWSLSVADV